MPGYLRQSTAATVRIGKFLDSTDAVTPKTALTIAQADVRLSKANAVAAQKNDATSATHDEGGYYTVPLNTTDTGTLGNLHVDITKTGALPVWDDFTVLPAAEYDRLFVASPMSIVTCGTGSTTTSVVTTLTGVANDHYKGRVVIFVTGSLAGQASAITASNGTTGALTVDALTSAPANGDKFFIV